MSKIIYKKGTAQTISDDAEKQKAALAEVAAEDAAPPAADEKNSVQPSANAA